MRTDFDVVVAGAGAAGLTAALALRQRGLKVALLAGRWPQPWSAGEREGLRVVALAPGPVALLQQLEVWPAIRDARAEPVVAMRIADGDGDFNLHFDAARLGVPALAYMVELELLQDRLAAAWRAVGGSTWSDSAICSQQVEGDTLRLELADGERLRCRLLVAADGAASPLRERAGIAIEQRDYGQHGLVATVDIDRPAAGVAWQRFLPGGPLALLPLAGRRCSIVWTQPSARVSHLLELDEAAFLAALNRAAGGVPGELVGCGPRAAFPLRLQLAQRYVDERLLLLGDAAHQVHPLAGQGLNLGLGDVQALADTLAWAHRGGVEVGDGRVLRRYERARRAHNWTAAHAFDLLERLHAVEQGPLPALRRLGTRLVDRSPAVKAWLARQAMGS